MNKQNSRLPEVTVILCSRNGMPYLGEQIRSILNQEGQEGAGPEAGDGKENGLFRLRLVISDDVSDDGSVDVARAAAAAYPDRVRFIGRRKPSGGAALHFMTVLKKLKEEQSGQDAPVYWMFSDQDDVWHPDKIRESLAAMEAAESLHGSGTPVLLHCDMRIVNKYGRQLSPSYVRYQGMSPERNRLSQLLVQNNVTGGAMMMNGPLVSLLASKPVPEHMVMHDHWIALTAAAFGKIVFLDRALYDYRQHQTNVLGAAKGGLFREVLGRFGLFRKDGKTKKDMDAHSRSVYDALFRQAAEFGRQYGKELSQENRKLLSVFVRMRKAGRLVKIAAILRYGFTFNRLHRTVGECLFL